MKCTRILSLFTLFVPSKNFSLPLKEGGLRRMLTKGKRVLGDIEKLENFLKICLYPEPRKAV